MNGKAVILFAAFLCQAFGQPVNSDSNVDSVEQLDGGSDDSNEKPATVYDIRLANRSDRVVTQIGVGGVVGMGGSGAINNNVAPKPAQEIASMEIFNLITEIQHLAIRNQEKISKMMHMLYDRANKLYQQGQYELGDKIETFIRNFGSDRFVQYCQYIISKGDPVDEQAFKEILQTFQLASLSHSRNI